ncbi:MAG: hypothetical protein HC780_26005 [Leptolyngbyaceae cyanobacterium CSU_1_3]|nr:hypothetical protein [Leptolyngbyaceae cyanobacterium CSU_1_3]
MDLIKEIIGLIKDLAWPLTILTISILFRKPLTSILLTLLPLDEKKQRNLKLKMGHFELESQVVAKVQERAEAIAKEPDLTKRLAMAKEPFLVEDALKVISPIQLAALEGLYKRKIDNAFYINWYQKMDGVDPSTYSELYKLGLIAGAPMYDGDEMAWMTPVGIALLERLQGSKDLKKIDTSQ